MLLIILCCLYSFKGKHPCSCWFRRKMSNGQRAERTIIPSILSLWKVSTLVTLIYMISSWIHPLNMFFFFINKCTHRLQIHISKFIHGNNKYSGYSLHSWHSVRRINIITLIQRNDCYWICNWFRTSTSIITFYKFRRKLVSIGKIPILSTKPVELWNTLQSLW